MFTTSKWILTFFFFSSIALADANYIKEVQGLLDTLTSKDPVRVTLTLRLADAQFEEYLKISNNNPNADASKALRHVIVKNYTNALSGFDGLFSAPGGSLKGKVQFQLARLYNDDGKVKEAEDIWLSLINQDALLDLKRESALRLAENYEGRSNYKGAEVFYLSALKLCASQDVCSYTHYRLGWVYHHEDRLSEAVSEIKQSLWDSKGQIREEALRDYITFLALVPGDGKETLPVVEELAVKTQRPSLIHEYSDALFASGQRAAGVYVLQAANKKGPTLRNFAHLLEEQYGFRDWTNFDNTLDEATTFIKDKVAFNSVDGAKDLETEKIFRRLTVQLDGERTTVVARSGEFKKTVLLYLSIYGFNSTRAQMIDGWLVAETNSVQRISQLKSWISEEVAAGRTSEEIRLREKRAAEAQKIKELQVVAEEMAVLRVIEPSEKKKRENAYQEAHAYYELKDYSHALPLFKDLAIVKAVPDQWAIQSENLALDILAQKKDFNELLSQVGAWLDNPNFEKWVEANPKHAEELRDLKKISLQAQFEQATNSGETPEALKLFNGFCNKNLFLPKSCENARVLAIKLKDEDTLLQILRNENKVSELANEEEASAHYVEAAQLLEPSLKLKTATNRDFIKIALLYELGERTADRNRILTLMTNRFSKTSSLGEEDLIYLTLKDAGLLSAASLKFPWKKENRTKLIGELEQTGRGTLETRKILMASCEDMGPAWNQVAITQVKELDSKQRSIKFYGKNSKRKFELRLAWLKKLTTAGDCYLQGASAKIRVILASKLAQSQYDLAGEIKNSPLPEGLDSDSQDQIKVTMAQMAEPFMTKGKDFSKIVTEQLEKIENPQERMTLKEKLDLKSDLMAEDSIPKVNEKNPEVFAKTETSTASTQIMGDLQGLHKNPNEISALSNLKKYYEDKGQMRLAAYYQGRLLDAQKTKAPEDKK